MMIVCRLFTMNRFDTILSFSEVLCPQIDIDLLISVRLFLIPALFIFGLCNCNEDIQIITIRHNSIGHLPVS